MQNKYVLTTFFSYGFLSKLLEFLAPQELNVNFKWTLLSEVDLSAFEQVSFGQCLFSFWFNIFIIIFFKIFRQELNINNNACSLTVWAEHKLISSWTSSVYFIFIFGHIIRNSTLPNSYFVMINIKIFILVETCFRALVHVIYDRRLVTALQKAVNAETQNIYHNLPHALFFFCLEFIVIAISTF